MKKRIQSLIAGTSLKQAERLLHDGRIDANTYTSFRRVWSWCAPRFAGEAGMNQDQFHARHGWQAMQAKIDKTRKAFGLAPIYSK